MMKNTFSHDDLSGKHFDITFVTLKSNIQAHSKRQVKIMFRFILDSYVNHSGGAHVKF